MKKFLILLCMLLLALPVFAEEALPTAEPTPTSDSLAEGYVAPVTPTPVPTPEPPPLRDDPVLQHVVEIAHRIDQLAESEQYIYYFAYFVASEEWIEAVSYGDHTRPVKMFHLDGQTLIDALYAGADPSQMLDFSRPELRRDLVGELAEILWGRREDQELNLLSLLSRYKIFALEGADGCGVFFLLYEDAAPVMVTWEGGNDCMDVAAFFMPDAELAAVTDEAEMSAWFASKGMPAVKFEEVPLT